ncbi:hypothetical protein O3G_MSEX005332 [Manduca sexta]|uniref:Integrase catalytic domain-containing protein n=1 Tax=Manduca sexta TaxID=7130 RepID=A0A922CJA3_MANSE|nr:hypothetical protein O3G_MSEX005332 [Manduca sexta]
MSYIGNLSNFDHKTGEWQIFKGKLTQFLKINEVKEENKSGILLTYLTDETYRLLRNLAYPKELDSLKFLDLILLLDSHFKPKQCSFADKAKFFGANRNPGESLGEWVARIRGLASYCEFGTALETNLRDRFVLGLGSGPERDKLFEQNASTLTLARAIELAEQAACAKEAKVMMGTSETVPNKEEPIYKVKIHQQHGRGETRPTGATGAIGTISANSSRCSVCGLKNHPREPPAPWPAAVRAWQRLHIDYMTIGQKVYLVLVDAYSKWLDCIYMRNGTSTSALIDTLKAFFSNFGLPESLVSDNDVKINSAEFKQFCNFNGIQYITTPIYHPPSNGLAENSVRNCKKMLKCIIKENVPTHQTQQKLLQYLFCYRNTVHCTTGQTPAQLVFGRKLRSRLDLILPTDPNNIGQTIVMPGKRCFEIGTMVWTRWYSARNETWKLGIIKEKIGNRMYKILIYELNVNCIRHVDQIMRYKGKNRQLEDMPNVSHQVPSLPSVPTLDKLPIVAQPLPPVSQSSVTVSEAEPNDMLLPPNTERNVDENATGHFVGGVDESRIDRSPVCDTSTNVCRDVADTDVPVPSLTPTRQKRNRKIVDYKKFF